MHEIPVPLSPLFVLYFQLSSVAHQSTVSRTPRILAMTTAYGQAEIIDRLRAREVRAAAHASKFSQSDGLQLIRGLLTAISEPTMTAETFFKAVESVCSHLIFIEVC